MHVCMCAMAGESIAVAPKGAKGGPGSRGLPGLPGIDGSPGRAGSPGQLAVIYPSLVCPRAF